MLELPADPELIDPRWLTAALGLEGAQVTGYRIGAHAGGFAVTSRVVRLHLELDRIAPSAPRSVIAKFPNPDFERTQVNCEAEIDFYTKVAARVPLPVPRCLHGAYDSASGRSVLLLEDLTDTRPGHPGDEGCDLFQAQTALTALARMQAASWRSEELARLGLRRRPLLGDDPQRWFSYTAERLAELRARGQYPVSIEQEGLLQAGLERLAAGWPELERGPFTLVHDDLHIQNFLIDLGRESGPRVIFLDWQDPSFGHPIRDVCQLIGGNTRPDVQRLHGPALLRTFHRRLAEHGVDEWSYDQSRRDFALAAARLALGYVRFLAEYTPRSPTEQATLDREWQRMLTMLQQAEELATDAPRRK